MSTTPAGDQAAVIAFRDAAAFQAWLDAHVDLRVGVWLNLATAGTATARAARLRSAMAALQARGAL